MKLARFLCTSALGTPPHDMVVRGVSVGRAGWGVDTGYLFGKTCLMFLFGVQCSQWCCSQSKCAIGSVGSVGLTVSMLQLLPTMQTTIGTRKGIPPTELSLPCPQKIPLLVEISPKRGFGNGFERSGK